MNVSDDQIIISVLVSMVTLLVLAVVALLWLLRESCRVKEPAGVEWPIGGNIASSAGGLRWRQRYECACGWHGTRELDFPPTHIQCGRCHAAAPASGPAEPVT